MDVRITPYSTQSSYSTLLVPRKSRAKTSYSFNRGQSQLELLKPNIPSLQSKKTRSINNNSILILSKRSSNKPKFSISVTSKMIPSNMQSPAAADKKGVLLYQQIERNKLFSNQSELLNRFNYKV